jgi:inner membrane protein
MQNMAVYFLIIGATLIILEAFIPQFVLFPLGIGFVLSSLLAYFIPNLGAGTEYAILAASLVLSWTIVRNFLKKKLRRPKIKTNFDRLVGETGEVEAAIDSSDSGYVKVFGDSWRAVTHSGGAIAVGEKVIVIATEDSRLIVELKGDMNS